MRIVVTGYGLVRGREPEFSLLARLHDLRVIGYGKKGKMHESGADEDARIEYIFVEMDPILPFDPVFTIRRQYECSSWATLRDLGKLSAPADVMVTHELWPSFSAQSVSVARGLRIPSVVIVHETIPRNFTFTYLPPYSFNTRKVVAQADLFVAQTRKAMAYALSCGVSSDRACVIYPGIDLDLFKPPLSPVDREETRILLVGNLVQKGLPELLQAFKAVSQSRKNLSLWVVGTGPARLLEEIDSLRRNYNLKYFGQIRHKELADIYRQVDLYCQPSRNVKRFGILMGEEQFGYALVEAMASGLPIIATDSGAIREVVGNGNMVVAQDDAGGLEDSLDRLVADQTLRKRIGFRNRLRAESLFDREKQAALLLQLIGSVI
jgi:glycosyltransferase involved in cell wall biosynthesis